METKMELIAKSDTHDYYIGYDEKGKAYYNAVPIGNNPPTGGYYNAQHFCIIKGIKNLF